MASRELLLQNVNPHKGLPFMLLEDHIPPMDAALPLYPNCKSVAPVRRLTRHFHSFITSATFVAAF
jgi:hypothetical protein